MSDLAIILLAAVVSMSLTEFLSAAFRTRFLLNRYSVLRWLYKGLRAWPLDSEGGRIKSAFHPVKSLDRAAQEVRRESAKVVDPYPVGKANEEDGPLDRQVVALATGDDRGAFYRLEADQLAASLSAASEIALNHPRKHLTLLVALARVRKVELENEDIKMYCKVDDVVLQGAGSSFLPAVRRQLVARVQRRLDELQIKTRGLQEISDQLAFFLFAAGAGALLIWRESGDWSMVNLNDVGVIGAIAGLVAPALRRLIRAASR